MITCEQLEIRVGYRALFQSLNFDLAANKSLALVGPNGCGKTTLLRCLAGLVQPSKGSVHIDSKQVWPNKVENFSTGVLYLNSNPAFYLDQTVESQLEMICNAFHIAPQFSDLRNALLNVGLDGRQDQVVRTLSTGQKRRLALAAIPLVKPQLILADEPTNGLDKDGLALSLKMFGKALENGSTIVTATHEEHLVSFCQDILELLKFVPHKQRHAAP